MKALHQTGDKSETKDSIDIGLLIVDPDRKKVQFSGANRPLIMIRNGEITEFKPDKMTLGLAPLKEHPFTNLQIDCLSGDAFYRSLTDFLTSLVVRQIKNSSISI